MNDQNKQRKMTPGEREEYQYLKNMFKDIEEGIFGINKSHDDQNEKGIGTSSFDQEV